jgi:hypothetical protein
MNSQTCKHLQKSKMENDNLGELQLNFFHIKPLAFSNWSTSNIWEPVFKSDINTDFLWNYKRRFDWKLKRNQTDHDTLIY